MVNGLDREWLRPLPHHAKFSVAVFTVRNKKSLDEPGPQPQTSRMGSTSLSAMPVQYVSHQRG